MYINYHAEYNDKDPKLKVGDRVRIPKYKNIFAKGFTLNWSEEVFEITNTKNTVHGHVLLVIAKVLEHYMKKTCRKKVKQNLGLKK